MFGNSLWSTGLKAWHGQLAWLARVTGQISPDGFFAASLCSPSCPKYTEAESVPIHLPGPPRPTYSHFSHHWPWSPKAVSSTGPCSIEAFTHCFCRHGTDKRREPSLFPSLGLLGCLPKSQPQVLLRWAADIPVRGRVEEGLWTSGSLVSIGTVRWTSLVWSVLLWASQLCPGMEDLHALCKVPKNLGGGAST